jgi:hypothetical protein
LSHPASAQTAISRVLIQRLTLKGIAFEVLPQKQG